MGSSPRGRGAPHDRLTPGEVEGIIPAGAGSTRHGQRYGVSGQDHPRGGGEHYPWPLPMKSSMGSSPRGRGARVFEARDLGGDRIIPAGAGSTRPGGSVGWVEPDHPRGGGEHILTLRSMSLTAGSSPRGRGAHRPAAARRLARGIIPAGAGSTPATLTLRTLSWDHPRGGGEHRSRRWRRLRRNGSSPRGRGALPQARACPPRRGIIPAGAGSTRRRRGACRRPSDHPRGGGEHRLALPWPHSAVGSSPRGRGAPGAGDLIFPDRRIIPAGAGSTTGPYTPPVANADHPRGGGEHRPDGRSTDKSGGSSPRGRGAPSATALSLHRAGIIPAGAGSTAVLARLLQRIPDHPRGGGEHRGRSVDGAAKGGSSPRGRGAPDQVRCPTVCRRIIPAGAGSTRSHRPGPPQGPDHPRGGGEHTC